MLYLGGENKGVDFMAKTISRSFLNGFQRVLNLYGANRWPDLYNSSEKDMEALRGDWRHVGEAIYESAERYRKEVRGNQSEKE